MRYKVLVQALEIFEIDWLMELGVNSCRDSLKRMLNEGEYLNNLANTIDMAQKKNSVTKVVSGIDKHKNELVLMNLGGGDIMVYLKD